MKTKTKSFRRRCRFISQSRHLFLLFVFVCFCSLLNAFTWHIKQDGTGDFTTIQEGIIASVDSDIVLVYPGTYYENINYNGKNITVASLELTTGDEQYIYSTIIDGQRITSCVSIISEETDTCLRGFTITNGQGFEDLPNAGGGLAIYGESDLLVQCDIINCVITENYGHIAAGMLIWNGKDNNNKSVASGLYFYKISTGNSSAIKKMLLLK